MLEVAEDNKIYQMIKFYHANKTLQMEFQRKSAAFQPWGRNL